MSALNRENAVAALTTHPGRVLAIDFGRRRVGLAISDPMQIIARGLDTVQYQSQKALVNHLVNVVRENEVVKVVIGLPRHMDGREGEMAKSVRRVMEALATALSLPVVAWDERLSTVQAERVLREMGRKHISARRDEVDRLAAVLILQNYLDSRARTKEQQI